MLFIGLTLAFIISGTIKRDKKPIVPFDIFYDRTVSVVLFQQFIIGAIYWQFVYFVPGYLQTVKGMDPLMSALHMLPFLLTHGLWSTVSGELLHKRRFWDRERDISYSKLHIRPCSLPTC